MAYQSRAGRGGGGYDTPGTPWFSSGSDSDVVERKKRNGKKGTKAGTNKRSNKGKRRASKGKGGTPARQPKNKSRNGKKSSGGELELHVWNAQTNHLVQVQPGTKKSRDLLATLGAEAPVYRVPVRSKWKDQAPSSQGERRTMFKACRKCFLLPPGPSATNPKKRPKFPVCARGTCTVDPRAFHAVLADLRFLARKPSANKAAVKLVLANLMKTMKPYKQKATLGQIVGGNANNNDHNSPRFLVSSSSSSGSSDSEDVGADDDGKERSFMRTMAGRPLITDTETESDSFEASTSTKKKKKRSKRKGKKSTKNKKSTRTPRGRPQAATGSDSDLGSSSSGESSGWSSSSALSGEDEF